MWNRLEAVTSLSIATTTTLDIMVDIVEHSIRTPPRPITNCAQHDPSAGHQDGQDDPVERLQQ